jgi:beta-lactamase superfamily II metal-dependent hydrolase
MEPLRRVVAMVLVLLLTGGLAEVASADGLPPGGTFTDDDGNPHEGNIEAIAAAGITKGCDVGLYCPYDKVTRGQMASFLARAFALPAASKDYFPDDNGSTHETNINRIAEAGVTLGYADGTFQPDGFVSRAQMGSFIARAMGLTPIPGDRFDDVSGPHEANINAIADAGVTLGCNPEGTLYCPAGPVMRDQMASFLARALGLTPILPPAPIGGGEMSVVFVAVRQGDAAVYRGACGETGVIDVNRYRAADVLAALDQYASRALEWIAVSHYDADHVGGVEDLARTAGVTVGSFYDRGGDRNVKDTQTYRDYYDYTTSLGTRHPVDIGDTFTLCEGADQITFTVVSAGTDGTAAAGVVVSEENDRGLCIHVEYHDFDLATCGDINGTNLYSRTDVESTAAPMIGDVEIVKINHHGSSYSSNSTWVNTLNPEVAILSVGTNSYGHPSPDVIGRWLNSGSDLYQTNSTTISTELVDGNIRARTTGTGDFEITTSASSRSAIHPVTP